MFEQVHRRCLLFVILLRLSSNMITNPLDILTWSVSSFVIKGANPNLVIYAVLLLPHENVAATSESGNMIVTFSFEV